MAESIMSFGNPMPSGSNPPSWIWITGAGITLMLEYIFLVCLVCFIFAAPAQALTWGDTFDINTTGNYNLSVGVSYSSSTQSLLSNSGTAYPSFPVPNYGNFTNGKIEIDWYPSLPTSSVFSSGFVIYADKNITAYSAYSGSGNRYLIFCQNSSGSSQTTIFKVVAGSRTSLGVSPESDKFILNTTHKISTEINATSISYYKNGVFSFSVLDSTFNNGYWGFLAGQGTQTYTDNLFINESATANIASCTMTAPTEVQCTQDGDNYDDPGVTSTWVWGDGATSTGTTGTHTYSAPGYYTVSLILTNVAGSSSDTCINCADVSALPWAQVISPSVDYHPDCPWWRFGIACDHLIKLTV